MEIFTLPDVGEGLTEAEITEWKVAVGDTVAVNDVLCEIETAKSLVELPSPYAGTVCELMVPEGETVEVGTPIIGIATGAETGAGDSGPEDEAGSSEPVSTPDLPTTAGPSGGQVASAAGQVGGQVAGQTSGQVIDEVSGHVGQAEQDAGSTSQSVQSVQPVQPVQTQAALVGSGPKADPVKRRPRTNRPDPAAQPPRARAEDTAEPSVPPPAQAPTPPSSPTPPQAPVGRGRKLPAAVGNAVQDVAGLWSKVLAKPPVRRIAKELGVDLTQVRATGQHGEITRTDVENYLAERDTYIEQSGGFWMPDSGDNEHRTERIKVKGVRRATAAAVAQSYREAPHVSIFVDVDASRTMEFVQRLKKNPDFEGVKVTPLLILAKAVIWAAARNPHVNATWTDEEILVKHYMNLGIAAATPRGLLVPNIKNANELSLRELAVELTALTKRARDGKTQPREMADGTISITNIGALGIDIGTPIINPGEVAIVAFGTIKQKPWVVSGEVIPRWITTLGGSFDHRVVDGDLSARFMADVAAIMEEPALLLE